MQKKSQRFIGPLPRVFRENGQAEFAFPVFRKNGRKRQKNGEKLLIEQEELAGQHAGIIYVLQ